MNEHRRRIVLSAGAWFASGYPSIVKANSRARIVAFIDIETPGARDACERYRRAVEHRIADPVRRPEVVFVPAVLFGKEEDDRQLKRVLESLQPTIIVAANPRLARAARGFKLGLPILFYASDDETVKGFTTSLIRPSAGMTGFILGATSTLKRREMLLRLAPQCRVLGILGNADERADGIDVERNHVVDPLKHIEKRYFSCESVDDLAGLLRQPDARSVDAWDVPYTQIPFRYAEETVREFNSTRKPVMYARLKHVRLGGMAAYDPNTGESSVAWADQTALLLDGVPISDIPVIQSVRYLFGINLAACRQLGINPPKSLIKIADLVIS